MKILKLFTVLLLSLLIVDIGVCQNSLQLESKNHSLQEIERIQSMDCNAFIDSSVLVRSSGFGEEQIINGNYQAVAQQYNGLSGQLKSVLFKGRVNPASGNALNTVRVVVYNANLGLPGTIIGSQNVTLDSSSLNIEVIATFSAPLNVNGDVIISVEPFSPVSDNFFIQRNNSPDGMFLNLIKIKQGNQWFKNLAAGDPAFDFDFYILPLTSTNLAAGFTANTVSNITTFNNISTNATSYMWNFGDGNSSTLTSPSHNYSVSGSYDVTLKAFRQGIVTCVDTFDNTINVVLTNIENIDNLIPGIQIENNLVTESLVISSNETMSIKIADMNGKEIESVQLTKGRKQVVDTFLYSPGMYFIIDPRLQRFRFIKLNQ